MKYLFYIVFCVVFTFPQNMFAQNNVAEQKILLGKISIGDFQKEPYKQWFFEEYNSYKLDTFVLSKITKTNNIDKILVYFGSWCSDSRREVPRFVKIMEYLKYNFNNILITGLDRQKSAPNYKNNIYNIEYVPTFIFYSKNKEIGRIIESPENTLETDIQKIIYSID